MSFELQEFLIIIIIIIIHEYLHRIALFSQNIT